MSLRPDLQDSWFGECLPTASPPLQVEVPVNSTVDINLGCTPEGHGESYHKHKVFVSTYLGYGSNEARDRYYRLLLREHLEKR